MTTAQLLMSLLLCVHLNMLMFRSICPYYIWPGMPLINTKSQDLSLYIFKHCVIIVTLFVPTGGGRYYGWSCDGRQMPGRTGQPRTEPAAFSPVWNSSVNNQHENSDVTTKTIYVTLLYNCKNNNADPIHKDLKLQLKKDQRSDLNS